MNTTMKGYDEKKLRWDDDIVSENRCADRGEDEDTPMEERQTTVSAQHRHAATQSAVTHSVMCSHSGERRVLCAHSSERRVVLCAHSGRDARRAVGSARTARTCVARAQRGHAQRGHAQRAAAESGYTARTRT